MPRRDIGVGAHLCLRPLSPYVVIIPLLSVTHGQCDARPTDTLPDCAGTKFILLGDSWLPRILILWHTRLNSLDLTFAERPGIIPRSVRWSGQRARI